VLAAVLTLLTVAGSPDAVHILHSVTVTFETDGSVTEETVAVIVPLTGRGVQRFSTVSVAYREGMEELEVLQAEVEHWRGGRGHSEATVSTGPHSILSSSSRLESSLRETVILVPGLEVGDTVKVDIVRTVHSLPLSDVYSYSFSPQLQDSVARSVFQISNMRQVELYLTEQGNHWEFRSLSPLSSHILAAQNYYTVSVATGNPARLSSDASEALDIQAHSNCELLDDIVRDNNSDPDRLREWVADNINYTGGDTGVWPGWSPRSPAETLTDGSGVCRDRAILLMWLLRKSGYDAYPALVSTAGKTPSFVDARSFDHMITVYRTPPDTAWCVLDPTPRGLPLRAGASFGLRGCTFLPLVPGGTGLNTIPLGGWNDTMAMNLSGELNIEENLITGSLRATAAGTPLELITTLYTQSVPPGREEMFRRYFGAVRCDSVHFQGNTVEITGSWKVYRNNEYLLLPGLRNISIHGTRIASMLLPCPPDSFVIDAPAKEILTVSLVVPPVETVLPEPVDTAGYSCRVNWEFGRLVYRETADITNTNSEILETLLLRSGTSSRTLGLE
jgi:hypothetical protein